MPPSAEVQSVQGTETGSRSLLFRLLRIPRDVLARDMFRALTTYCRGAVLDVGGWDFYLLAKRKGVTCDTWTAVEPVKDKLLQLDDPKFTCIHADGCNMPEVESNQYDTLLNIQVLEHVFEPIKMVGECARVLKPGGHGIFLIPQTGYMHMAPHHYCNFTLFWIEEAMERAGLQIVELKPIGGLWSSMGMHSLFFFLESFRFPGFSISSIKRSPLFYLLWPFMAVYAIIAIPICFLLSLGDLKEAANNHLVVVRKK